MELIVTLASFATLAGLAGILYPFRPFGKRRNALLTVFASVLVVGFAAPSVPTGTTSLADKIEKQMAENSDENRVATAEPAAVAESVTAGKPVELAEPAAPVSEERSPEMRNFNEGAEEQETEILQKASILQWENARNLFVQLRSSGHADEEFSSALEEKVLELVRPLPSSEREKNLEGYELLSAIRPDNSEYQGKVESYKQAIVKARNRVLSVLQTKTDKVEGITWYQHPNKPRYVNSRSTAYLYIGKKGEAGRPWLRMKVIYAADTWLFVKNVTAWHDGLKEPLISGRFERDNNADIWEWMDVSPDFYQIEVLRSLANAKEAILRFEGQQYYKDVSLSAGDKKAIREMLEAYDAMQAELVATQ